MLGELCTAKFWQSITCVKLFMALLLGISFGFVIPTFFFVAASTKEQSMEVVANSKDAIIRLVQRAGELNQTFARRLLEGSEEVEARDLAQRVRILCLVVTAPHLHTERAAHVHATWGAHCNKILFFSEEPDKKLPLVQINATGGMSPWSKAVGAFKTAHKQYLNDYDWFLKTEDDAYVVVESLRRSLARKDPAKASYMGFQFKAAPPFGYMDGGPGYVLSREAVKKVVEEAFDGKNKNCRPDTEHGNDDDLKMADCLAAIGVKPENLKNSVMNFLDGTEDSVPKVIGRHWWKGDYLYWPQKGASVLPKQVDFCCNEFPVSFHQVSSQKMYMLEYLIYHVRVFGVLRPDLKQEGQIAVPPTPQKTTSKAQNSKTSSLKNNENTTSAA